MRVQLVDSNQNKVDQLIRVPKKWSVPTAAAGLVVAVGDRPQSDIVIKLRKDWACIPNQVYLQSFVQHTNT